MFSISHNSDINNINKLVICDNSRTSIFDIKNGSSKKDEWYQVRKLLEKPSTLQKKKVYEVQ